MTNIKEKVECKLNFLYEKLEELDDAYPNDSQANFLLNEIDYYRTELLKIEYHEYCNELEKNEDD